MDLIVSSVPADSPEEEALYQRWIQSRRVDGMVLNRTRVVDWRVEILAKNKLPFATLGHSSSAPGGPHVSVNERAAFTNLVAGLVRKGHRRIAYIGGPAKLTIQVEREAGYMAGLAEAGLAVDPALNTVGDLTEPGGYRLALSLLGLAQPPTAILGCNDQTALGVLRAAQELGMRIGGELAIAGYDGIQETAYSTPPLTTATQPTYDIARKLVRMLITLIKGKPLEKSEIWVEPEIIWRPSTGSV
jgi:LacI family transcriptional regulator